MSDSIDDWTFIPAFPKQPHLRGSPLPVPESTRTATRSVHSGQWLTTGGLPVPKPKSRPRSLAGQTHGPPRVDQYLDSNPMPLVQSEHSRLEPQDCCVFNVHLIQAG